jgi:hypothetical protein
MMLPLAGLYADADAVTTLYTAFLALDLVLSLDAATGARPRRRCLP